MNRQSVTFFFIFLQPFSACFFLPALFCPEQRLASGKARDRHGGGRRKGALKASGNHGACEAARTYGRQAERATEEEKKDGRTDG